MPFHVARFVFYCLFWFFELQCPFLLFIALGSFCCFSLLVAALSGFSLLLCQPPSIGPELKQMNEYGNEKCFLLLLLFFLLLVARFDFWDVLPFAVRPFLLLFVALAFEMESVLSQKTKTGKCHWLLVLDITLLILIFCWYERPKRAKKAKSPNGNHVNRRPPGRNVSISCH